VKPLPSGTMKLLTILIVIVIGLAGTLSYVIFYPRTDSHTASVATVTSKPLPTHKMFGQVFFDYNGNGRQDSGEPAVPNVTIALDRSNVTATNVTGWYSISSVAQGNHTLRIFPPRSFRYMCESALEFRSVKESYGVSVLNDTRKDVGLMEGFLTTPFNSGTRHTLAQYVNISNSSRLIDWQGGSKTYQNPDVLLPTLVNRSRYEC